MFNRIKEILPALAIPGTIFSRFGGTMFGTNSFLKYVYHGAKENYYTHPVTVIAVSVNFVVTCATRIPAFFRKTKSSENNQQVDKNDYLVDVRVNDDTHQPSDHPIEEETPIYSNANLFFTCICYLTNAISGFGVLLGSYNGGKSFCEFIAAQTDSSLDDEEWKYYLTHIFALYLAVSNVYAFGTYVAASVNKNREKLIKLMSENNPLNINKKMATTAVLLSSLNMMTSASYNYISTKSALAGINKDLIDFPAMDVPDSVKIPDLCIMILASTMCVSGLVTAMLTFIPQLYDDLEPVFNITESPSEDDVTPQWQLAAKGVLYPFGVLDSITMGAQGYSSLALTAQDLMHVYPYGYITSLSLICAISTFACNVSFYSKKGIDAFIEDIQLRLTETNNENANLNIQEPLQEEAQESDFLIPQTHRLCL